MKIIDATIFFNEIDLLKMRLELLYDVVDTFVICESSSTFTGKEKPLYLMDRYHEFEAYKGKIVYLKYEIDKSISGELNPWQIEASQRNFLSTYLVGLDDEDICFFCDIDEIWNPELVDRLKSGDITQESARLQMKLHYYYLNCQGFGGGNSLWTHPFYSSIGLIKKNTDLNSLRFAGQMGSVDQAGWHFSYLGGASQIAMKIEAFSHQEFNNEEIKNRDRLERCLKLGIDPFGRGDHDWAFRPIDFYPPKLSAIMRRYPHFVRSNLND